MLQELNTEEIEAVSGANPGAAVVVLVVVGYYFYRQYVDSER